MLVSHWTMNEDSPPPMFATDTSLRRSIGAEIDDDEYGVEEGGEVIIQRGSTCTLA